MLSFQTYVALRKKNNQAIKKRIELSLQTFLGCVDKKQEKAEVAPSKFWLAPPKKTTG